MTGDRERLHDLVSNLLFNAIAYNQPGGTASIEVRSRDAVVQVLVRDHGIGISASDLPHIFDRFYRGEIARAREPAGAGLALAQWIACAHRGSIACTSKPGAFTEFLVRLPAAAQAAAADAGAGAARREARLTTPIPSTDSVTARVQIGVSPSTPSSE